MKTIKFLFAGITAIFMMAACTNPKPAHIVMGQAKSDIYTCPMHPNIQESHPGNCPICGMVLVKKLGQASQSAGISLNTVLQPVNSWVISTIKAINPQQKAIANKISAQGYLNFDGRAFNNIAARFSGRIQKLYIKYAFEQVHRGQRIFDIYSPDMVTAQQDLLYLKNHSAQETGFVNAATQKLLLLGMTTAQVNQVLKTQKVFYSLPVFSPYQGHVHDIPHSAMTGFTATRAEASFNNNQPLAIREGMYVEQGQQIFNVVDGHCLWAIIKVDAAAAFGLKLNQPVQLTLPDAPGIVINGKVNFIEPTLQYDDKSTTIRVYIGNANHALKVNSLVKATIKTGVTTGLWIPRTALVDLGQTKIVWLKQGSIYKAHQVITGTVNNNEVAVKKGLSITDNIAADAQYLTDSESFIKTNNNEK